MDEAIAKAGGLGNFVLYNMCLEYRSNKDPKTIEAKLWLIGRAYSASAERKAGKGFKLIELAEKIAESDLENLITSCKKISRLDESNLHIALEAHHCLTDLFGRFSKLERRSLASKYLHFHAPSAFFIYDSIVLRKLRPETLPYAKRIPAQYQYDKNYEVFCRRCFIYRDKVLEPKLGKPTSVRYLDSVLYGYSATNL